jgi:hypothetical protein
MFTVLVVLPLLLPLTAQAKAPLSTCAGANAGGSFPAAFTDRAQNLVVGPLSLPFATRHADVSPDVINRFGGDKFPVLLREGRTATIRIAKALRPGAAGYERVPLGEAGFLRRDRPVRKLVFAACPQGEAQNVVDDRRVTFWMLWMKVRAPACVYLDISIDGKRTRKRTTSWGAGACPARRAARAPG